MVFVLRPWSWSRDRDLGLEIVILVLIPWSWSQNRDHGLETIILVCRPWSWSLETMFLVSRNHVIRLETTLRPQTCGLGLEPSGVNSRPFDIHSDCMQPSMACYGLASSAAVQFFYRPDAIPVAQPTVSKHWRETTQHFNSILISTAFWHKCIVKKQTASMVWNICWLQKPSIQKHTIMIFIRARTEPKILDSNWVCSGSE